MTLLNPVDLGLSHVRVIVQAMVRVANSDGAHQRELVLIREFYESCREDAKGLADFQDIVRSPFDAEVARDVLDTTALKLTFLASCWLVAYADGHVSADEERVIGELVKELGIDAATASQAREIVKDQLLMQLAGSSNVEALQKIAKSL